MPKKQENSNSLESTISLLLGIFVVVVVGVLLFKYFKGNIAKTAKNGSGKISETEKKESDLSARETIEPEIKTELPAKYVVKLGDNLWKISIKFFGTGYNWVDIAKENTLKSNNFLSVGQELTIPKVSPKIPVAKISKTGPRENAIDGDEYTIVKGDSLWKISVRAYQDGYKWQEIAKASNLSDPNVIHPGNVLVIPR